MTRFSRCTAQAQKRYSVSGCRSDTVSDRPSPASGTGKSVKWTPSSEKEKPAAVTSSVWLSVAVRSAERTDGTEATAVNRRTGGSGSTGLAGRVRKGRTGVWMREARLETKA